MSVMITTIHSIKHTTSQKSKKGKHLASACTLKNVFVPFTWRKETAINVMPLDKCESLNKERNLQGTKLSS